MNDVIFATKNLKTVSKKELKELFKYLRKEEFRFEIEEMVWHDKKREHVKSFHYIGLLSNECGGVVVHIPVKAWKSFEKEIQRSDFHTPIPNEFTGQLFKRKGGIDGPKTARPKIVWQRPTPAGTPPDQPKA